MSQSLQLMFLSMHGNCIELKKKKYGKKNIFIWIKKNGIVHRFCWIHVFSFFDGAGWVYWEGTFSSFFFKIIIIFFFVFSRKEDWIMENYCLWLGLIWHYLMHFVGWWRRIFLFLILTLWIILSFNSVKGFHIDK
jgi:hypothetical protein